MCFKGGMWVGCCCGNRTLQHFVNLARKLSFLAKSTFKRLFSICSGLIDGLTCSFCCLALLDLASSVKEDESNKRSSTYPPESSHFYQNFIIYATFTQEDLIPNSHLFPISTFTIASLHILLEVDHIRYQCSHRLDLKQQTFACTSAKTRVSHRNSKI